MKRLLKQALVFKAIGQARQGGRPCVVLLQTLIGWQLFYASQQNGLEVAHSSAFETKAEARGFAQSGLQHRFCWGIDPQLTRWSIDCASLPESAPVRRGSIQLLKAVWQAAQAARQPSL